MKRIRKMAIIVCCILILLNVGCVNEFPKIDGMSVEYTETPLGIDVAAPRFGWRMEYGSDVRGITQVAYQLAVTDETGKEVWNTGKVESDLSQNIEYSGETLQPTTRYAWNVTVWDNKGGCVHGNSWFETSLMTTTDKSGWNGAKWIGGDNEDLVLYSHYLPVFRLDLSFSMNPQPTVPKIGFFYGANDDHSC